MSYNFKNLADVELLNEVPEGCTAFAEVDGVVKRVPSKGLGGESGIKTVIIKDNYYDDILSGNDIAPDALSSSSNDFTTSMAFEEVVAFLASGEPLQIYVLGADSEYTVFQAIGGYSFSLFGSIRGIVISVSYYSYYRGHQREQNIIWTSDEEIYYQPLG